MQGYVPTTVTRDRILDAEEDDFLDKVPKVIWRGSQDVGQGHDAREGLVHFTKNQRWSDVQTMKWSNKSDIDANFLNVEDHCGYTYTAYTEGNTPSSRLNYLLNCHSVPLIHELEWTEHYSHLLLPGGNEQNYASLKRDCSDLPRKMKNLAESANLPRVQAIADNARQMFRERYLTPAAEACYWRALIRDWASVQGFEPEILEKRAIEDDWWGGKRSKRTFRGAPFESYVIMEQVAWQLPAQPRNVCVEER